ncbi:MAG: type IV secretion system DNA-binding domain-containing protein [Candidatus Portnoybacteria bacterium]|nr:type IV secretion system DNA-binding domain-containing protein [Candidatus Portnoybacteria bacterium]
MDDGITYFAETNFRNEKVKFGIKTRDRRRHFYIIGKTGVGKTTLEENMAIQDIQAGKGVGIVDPHGEFAEKMLDYVPSERINDVVYFNPADLDYPIAFNAIEKVDPEHRHLVASGLVGVFKKLWAETWGPRLEYVLRNAILALLEYPGSTLLGIMRMLTDKEYRKKVTERISDPVVRAFWTDEFAKYPDRFMAEAVAPIQNKVGQFLTSPLIRNIVGQTKSSLNIREIMDNEKIFIMNLSKGRIGEDNSMLLGAMLITRLQLAAMSRIDIPEEKRNDFYLYVDEFQNFATESFATILSEARKYHLSLILAHQYINQMVEPVRDAVMGNVGTIVSFRIGAFDAEFLEKEFMPEFTINDLVGLGFAQVYLKLMIDGMASRPFSATTLPPIPRPEISYRDTIIKVSRERYSTSRQEVEDKIARWSGVIAGEIKERSEMGPEIPNAHKQEFHKSKEPSFPAVCDNCGLKVNLKFQPDGVRPVYCRECLKLKDRKEIPNKPAIAKSAPILGSVEAPPISLKDALVKPLAKFSDNRRKKKEVNLADLRQTLRETIGEEKMTSQSSPAAKPIEIKKNESAEESSTKHDGGPEKEGEKNKDNNQDSKGGEIAPGETVDL